MFFYLLLFQLVFFFSLADFLKSRYGHVGGIKRFNMYPSAFLSELQWVLCFPLLYDSLFSQRQHDSRSSGQLLHPVALRE